MGRRRRRRGEGMKGWKGESAGVLETIGEGRRRDGKMKELRQWKGRVER